MVSSDNFQSRVFSLMAFMMMKATHLSNGVNPVDMTHVIHVSLIEVNF